jgi:geranylgeranyl pyrophosphate synthase
MVLNKTSVLPRLCVKFISEIMNLKEAQRLPVIKYVETLGAAFQIQDDVIAVVSEQYAKERGVGEDIREGKRSLMVIHSMAKGDQSSSRLQHILGLKTNDEALLREAIGILIDNGSVEFAKRRARDMMDKAWTELSPQLPAGKPKDNIESLSRFLIDRDI